MVRARGEANGSPADGAGDTAIAADTLLPLVYDELRGLASRFLRDEPFEQTLPPTALVHEVYIRMVAGGECSWESRGHFFAAASRAMRHLLIDHARRRRAAKRGGGRPRLTLDDAMAPAHGRADYLIALDDALTELASLDRQLSVVVELRFFGGLTVEETARVLGVAPITVKRMWKLAKGWLHRQIAEGA